MPSNTWKRKDFLTTTLAVLAGSALPLIPHRAAAAPAAPATTDAAITGATDAASAATDCRDLTIRQVIGLILAEIPGAPFTSTVDTVKSGNPDQPVKGIVTTMFATDAVIEQAVRAGANFIIAHEPTFYNHTDETDWLGDDKVLRFKKGLLEQHGIVVWRFHDYWHAHRPDGILMGVLTALGWEKYYDPAAPHVLTLPEAGTLGKIVGLSKERLKIGKVKVIGDLARDCRKIAILPGSAGGRAQITLLQQAKPDLLIVGELNEWETAEYVRDARYQGEAISLMVLGHSVSEEPGMQWLIPWLQPKVPGITITHIPSGDPFQTI